MSVIALPYVQKEPLFQTWRMERAAHAVPFELFRARLNGRPAATTVSNEVAQPKVVGFLGFDGVNALHLAGPLDAFAATRVPDEEYRTQPAYETVILGLEKKTFVSQSGATFTAQDLVRNAPTLDTIVIPGGVGLRDSAVSKAITRWLLEHAASTRRIGAICGAIYPLAATGLLEKRRIATHWRIASDIARTYPQLKVNFTASFQQDGCFYTCGGGTAPIEMSLALVGEDYGEETAMSVARELVVDFRPAGSVEHYVRTIALPPRTEERLASLPEWIATRLPRDLSIDVLAERTRLSPRHFSRVFKHAFTVTPAEFVEWLRINEAARRLLSQDCSIESIGMAVGFRTADAFRKAFYRAFALTPSGFQRRYRRRSNGSAVSAKVS